MNVNELSENEFENSIVFKKTTDFGENTEAS